MKKIFIALSALMLTLAAIVPMAIIADDNAPTQDYEVSNGAKGMFVGGTATVGTNVPRTWRNTDGLTIALTGVTTNREQQFALGAGNAFLMNGIFTVTAPNDAQFVRADITFASTNNGTPAIKFPSSENAVTAPSSGAEKTISYSFDEPVSSFNFEIAGTQRMLVKRIRLIHTGVISSTVTVAQTVSVNMGNGSFSGTGTFHGTWTSTTNPRVTIKAGSGNINNMKDDNGQLVAYVGLQEAGKTFTIDTESPAYISKVRMGFKDFDSDGQVTITMGGKTYTASSAEQFIDLSFNKGDDIKFVLAGPNKGIKFTTFDVTTISEKKVNNAAQTITVEPSVTSGALSGGASTWHHTWTSNRTNPQVLIKATNSGSAVGNMSYVNNKFVIASGRAGSSDFTVTCDGSAYYVSSIKLSVSDANGGGVQIAMGGKSITTSQAEQTIEATFDRGTPAVFSLSGNNHNIEVTDFVVTLSSYLSGSSTTSPSGTLVINNAGAGTFTGGNANQGTEMPRTWNATVSGTPVTITLKGTGANGKQQLAADGEALLMCGQFTLALGGDAKISKAEFAMTSTAQGTPTLRLPAGSNNEKVTTSDAALHTLSYTWDTPVNSFDFDTKASLKALSVKSITLTLVGGGSSSELPANSFEIKRSECQEKEGSRSSANYCRTLVSSTNPIVTLQCSSDDNNIDRRAKDFFQLHAGNSANKDYNIFVPEEYILEGVSFNYRNHSGNPSTLIAGGKTYTGSDSDQQVTVTGNTTNEITINIAESNKGVELRNLVVSVKPKSAVGPGPDEPAPAPSEPITEETVFSIERSLCDMVGGNSNKTYCAGFTSTNTNPVVTISGNGQNNADATTSDYFLLHSGNASNSITWSIKVPNGFVITAVSMDYRTHNGQPSTVLFGTNTYTGTATDQKLSISGLNSPAFSFTSNDSNKGIEIRNLKVTVKPDPNGEGEGDPGTPDKPGYIGGGNPVQFEISPAPAGQFAADTKWYVMTLAASESGLPHNESANRITLTPASAKDANQQWCVTGNATDGYTLYNKAAGPSMMLAAPKEMKGTTGSDSYAILKAPGDASYCYTWDITPANRLGKTSFFIAQHGVAANKLNNRSGILAFWTGGADDGSTFLFYPPENIRQTAEYLKAPAIFPRTGEAPYNVCYRIPAIAVVGAGEHAGRIIAFSDYRKSGNGDISPSSNIDQHYTYSDDGGVMWKHPDWLRDANGKPVSLARNGISLIDPTDHRDNSFSDPCVAADRESGRIILMSPAGTAGFFSGQYPENPTEVARWFSYDGGDTWTDADYDVTRQIHAVLLKDAYDGKGIDGMFWGSGKIHQSRYVKVGDYYRLYHAISVRSSEVGGIRNYVLYSDDFGENWNLLGTPDKAPVMSNGDEPKCEELPDGSVLLAARGNGGNRNWNIFKFTNIEKAEGEWGSHVNRNLLGQNINACNGEPLMVPAIDNTNGRECWVLLQSVPWNGNRSDVSIVFKKIDGPETYSSPSVVAENWEGRYQVSYKSSAYSTMAQMLDGNIAFIYEENTWEGQTYTEMFRKLSLSQITRGRYRHINEAADPEQAFNALRAKLDPYLTMTSEYVGDLTPTFLTRIQDLIKAYYSTRDKATLAELDKLLNGPREQIGIADGPTYTILNAGRGDGHTFYMTLNGDNQLASTDTYSDACDWAFIPTSPASRGATDLGQFFIQHVKTGRYAGATGANETLINTSETRDGAAIYEYQALANGGTALVCTTPTGPNNSLHMSQSNRVVPWNATAAASKWLLTPDDIDAATVTGIDHIVNDVTSTPEASDEVIYDIYGRRVNGLLRPGSIYITNRGRKFIAR